VPWLPYPRLGVAALEPPSGDRVCAFVNSGGAANAHTATLDCRGAGVIAAIEFASYGTPRGYCTALVANASCDAQHAAARVAAHCVGRASCVLASNDAFFGGAPCAGATRLAVRAACSVTRNFTYWDFAWPDESMLDFLRASGDGTRSAIPNFSTPPQWLYTGGTLFIEFLNSNEYAYS
jgi:hypothetical protein